MAAGVANLFIQQGETYSRTIILTNPKAASGSTDATGYAIGSTSISCGAGGAGVLAVGDYVSFGTELKQYKVTTGIADLSTGGTMVLDTGLEVAIPASATAVSIYSPFDLTGYLARAEIRQTADASQIAATFTCTVETPETSGVITIALDSTETSNIATPGERYYNNLAKYTWDMEVYSGSSVTRILNGMVSVSPEVTR